MHLGQSIPGEAPAARWAAVASTSSWSFYSVSPPSASRGRSRQIWETGVGGDLGRVLRREREWAGPGVGGVRRVDRGAGRGGSQGTGVVDEVGVQGGDRGAPTGTRGAATTSRRAALGSGPRAPGPGSAASGRGGAPGAASATSSSPATLSAACLGEGEGERGACGAPLQCAGAERGGQRQSREVGRGAEEGIT